MTTTATSEYPHVVIVGAGFADLNAAFAFKDQPVRVTLVDQWNHHLFQPLLYQVATAMLSPADIASPIRGSMATIGRNRAVAIIGPLRLHGFVAWIAWVIIHVFMLIGFRNRVVVMVQWIWAYATRQRSARLIIGGNTDRS